MRAVPHRRVHLRRHGACPDRRSLSQAAATRSAKREAARAAARSGWPLNALLGSPGAIARRSPARRRVHIRSDAPSLSRCAAHGRDDMTDTMLPVPLTLASRVDQVFPTLTSEQIARLAVHGQVRHIQRGEVPMEAGEQAPRFFVVTAGHIVIVRPSGVTEALVAVLQPGQFTGELTMLSGRRGFVRIRAGESGEVIEVEREHVLALVQTDGELSAILL